jgi:glutaredoxin
MHTHYRCPIGLRDDIQRNGISKWRLVWLIVLFFGYTTPGEAQIYKWVDKNGVVHFGQTPPQGTRDAAKLESTLPRKGASGYPQVEDEKIQSKIQSVEKKSPRVIEERLPVITQQVTAEMYATSWCGYCRKAREYFQARGIPLIEYDIEVDAAAAQRKQQIDSRPGVPLVVINGRLIHGYAPAKYEQALANQR